MVSEHKGVLLVVSGPSGAGKGTICAELLRRHKSIAYSISATTRARRGTELDGVDYFFWTKEKFEAQIAQGGFLEYARVFDNYYGTPLAYVEGELSAGRDVLLEIDVQGALRVRERLADAVLVFILPPDLAELARRLRGRGTDAEEIIVRRLSKAQAEIKIASQYDYVVVNNKVDEAVAVVEAICAAEHAKAWRQEDVIAALATGID